MFKLSSLLDFLLGPRLYISGGGGGQPANTTQTQTQELPEWARPYAKDTLAKTAALTDVNQNPYQTYDANRIAGFSDMQRNAMTGAQNMSTAPQLDTASGLAGLAGQRAMGINYNAGRFANQFRSPQDYQAGIFGNQFQAPQNYQAGNFGAQQVSAPGLQDYQMQGPADVNAPNLQQYQMGPAERVSADTFNQPGTASQYMNPYMQNVVDIQQREAQRQADIAGTQRGGQAARSGAFGGSRANLLEAEAARNLATQKGDIQATGQQAAFQNAQQQFNAEQNARMQAALANQGAGLTVGQQNLGAQLGIQQLGSGQNLQAQLANQGMGYNVGQQNLAARLGTQQFGAGQNLQAQLANQQQGMNAQQMLEQSRQFGAGQGMTAAQQRAQYGLAGQQAGEQSRQFGAGQGMTAAQQRAQYGLSAQQLGEQSRQYGAGLGMQGLQTGLQAAGQLGQLGGQQFQQGMDINKLQSAYGAQQQQLEQQGLSQSYQDFLNQQNYPYKQLGFMSDILRGTPTGSSSSMNMYQAQPGGMQQLAGLGLGAYGVSQLMKAEGGSVHSYDEGGSVTSDYNTADIIDKLSDQQLQAARQNAQVRKDVGTLELIDEELAQRASDRGGMSAAFNQLPPNAQEDMYKAANGGIVAFADGGSYRKQAAEDRETLKGLSFAAPTSEDYEKGVAARLPFIEKMYGADTLSPYLEETKAERQKIKSGSALDEAKGIGALLAAAELFAAPNMNQGAAGAIKAFTGEVARVKKDNKEADRLLRSSEIQLATAAQARKEGLTGKAMTAQDKADGQVMEAKKLEAGVKERVAQLSGGLAQAELSGESQVRAAGISANKPTDLARQTDIVYQGMLEAGAPANKQTMAKAAAQAASDLGRYPGEARERAAANVRDDKFEVRVDKALENNVPYMKAMQKGNSEEAARIRQTVAAELRGSAPQEAPAQGAPTPAPARGAPQRLSQAQFNAAPSGTVFVAPDGSLRTKP